MMIGEIILSIVAMLFIIGLYIVGILFIKAGYEYKDHYSEETGIGVVFILGATGIIGITLLGLGI